MNNDHAPCHHSTCPRDNGRVRICETVEVQRDHSSPPVRAVVESDGFDGRRHLFYARENFTATSKPLGPYYRSDLGRTWWRFTARS